MGQQSPILKNTPVSGMQAHVRNMQASLLNTNIAMQRMTDVIGEHRNRLHAVLSTLPEGMLLLDSKGMVILKNELGQNLLTEIEKIQGEDRPGLIDLLYYKIRSENLPSITHELYDTHAVYRMIIKQFHPESPVERYAIYIKKQALSHGIQSRSTTSFMMDLIASLAHEINNPLTPILALTSPAMRLGDEYDDTLETIYQAGNRIAGVISQMLILETAMQNQALQSLSLDQICREAIQEYCIEFPETFISFHCTVTAPQCYQNESGLKRLITFLLMSLKNQRGEHPVSMEVYLEDRNCDMILAIRERGTWPDTIERASIKDAAGFADFYRLLAEIFCQQARLDFHIQQTENGHNGFWINIPATPDIG
ncbi:HAMP domain-containing histidine kinase [bacterium]|nr:HAMP domain-containing histidine kinase [bacterium]